MIWSICSAIVWGSSAKHARGQKVGLDHLLEDEDGKFRALTYRDPCSTTFPQSFTSRRSKIVNSKISNIAALHSLIVYDIPYSHIRTLSRFHDDIY